MPKHAFIFWLAVRNKLQTKDRLKAFIEMKDSDCVLCQEEEETVRHLFFNCKKITDCLGAIKDWLGWKVKATEMLPLIRWLQRNRLEKNQRKIYIACIASLLYWIWRCRNRKVWENIDISIVDIVEKVKKDVRNRIIGIGCIDRKAISCNWLRSL